MEDSIMIIGAGPGGLILALTLAQYGIRSHIIDKQKSRSPFTKALSLQPRTLEILKDLNLLGLFKKKGRVIRKNRFFANGKYMGYLNYNELPSQCNFLLSVAQPELENIIEKALNDEQIFIERETECIDIEFLQHSIQIKTRDLKTEKITTHHKKYVIAADGGKSFIRSKFFKKGDIQLKHEFRYDSNFIMGDFHMPQYPFKRDERHTYFKNKMICAFAPMAGDQVRVIAFGLRKAQEEKPTPDEFSQLVQSAANIDLDFDNGSWLSRFYPSRFMINRFQLGNLFFLGDAAHIMSPIGAQGINLSIEDAANLGWKLGMVLTKKIELEVLKSYHQERSEAAETVLEETHSLHKKLSNPFSNFIFMQQLKFIKNPEISQMVLYKQTHFLISYSQNNSKKQKYSSRSAFTSGMRLVNEQNEMLDLFDLFSRHKMTILTNTISETWDPSVKPSFQNNEIVLTDDINLKSQVNTFYVDRKTLFHKRLKKSPSYLIISPDKYVFRTFENANDVISSEIISENALQTLNL